LRLRIANEPIPLDLLVIILITIIILFPSNILRLILASPFLLFFPGYTLMAALFTKKEGMGGIARVALSFGLSIAVVPIIGLILNYTPWGIRVEPALYSIASFIFITSSIAWLRRRRLLEEEQFSIEFQMRVPGWRGGVWDRVLSIILRGCYSGGVRHTQLCYIQSQGRREVYDLSRGTHDDKINQDIYFVNEHCYNTKNSIKIFGEWNFSYRPEA